MSKNSRTFRKPKEATPLPPPEVPDDEEYTVTMTVTANNFQPVPPPDVIVLRWWQFTPEGYYRVRSLCHNCGIRPYVAILCGKKDMRSYDVKCPNCGC